MPIRLTLATGLRQGELLALRWEDIDVGGAVLTVNRTLQVLPGTVVRMRPPKTRNAHRTIELSARTVALLRQHRQGQNHHRLRVGSPWLPRNFYRGYRAHVAAAGISKPATVVWHTLRRTAATHWSKAGVEIHVVSRRLGHASAAFTMDTYGHMLAGMQRRAAEAFDRLIATEPARSTFEAPYILCQRPISGPSARRDSRSLSVACHSWTAGGVRRPCAHGSEGMNESSDPKRTVERWGLILLVAVVVAIMLALTLALISPSRLSPLTPYFYLSRFGSSNYLWEEGIELALFPLSVVVGLLVRPRLGRFAALASGRGASWLPFLCSVILVALAWYFVSTWFVPATGEWFLERTFPALGSGSYPAWVAPGIGEKRLGAVLLASVGYAGAVLYPRLTAALAGAIASPILLSLATLASPQWQDYDIDEKTGLRYVMLAIAGVVSLLSVAAWFRLRTHIWSHAVWTGGVMLFFAVWGYWSELRSPWYSIF